MDTRNRSDQPVHEFAFPAQKTVAEEPEKQVVQEYNLLESPIAKEPASIPEPSSDYQISKAVPLKKSKMFKHEKEPSVEFKNPDSTITSNNANKVNSSRDA